MMWHYFYTEIFKAPSELADDFERAKEWCRLSTTRTFSLDVLSLSPNYSFFPTKKVNIYNNDLITKSGSYTIRCKFRSKRDAALFKMFFYDVFSLSKCPTLPDYNKIILPLFRTSVLANEIIGVQPMTAPIAQIHSLRVRYKI
jgi:hypothetical protein